MASAPPLTEYEKHGLLAQLHVGAKRAFERPAFIEAMQQAFGAFLTPDIEARVWCDSLDEMYAARSIVEVIFVDVAKKENLPT